MSDQSQDAVTLSKTERREYQVGVIAALILAAVLVFTAMANRGGKHAADGGFILTAAFHRADGLHIGSPVRVAGVNLGMVSAEALDNQQRAVLTLRMAAPIALPDDTAAVIETDGLFGSKYIELRTGGSDQILQTGARLNYTQDSVIIEDLVALIVRQAKGAKGIVDPTPDESNPESKP